MYKRDKNIFTQLLMCGLIVVLLFAALFAGCEAIEGTPDEILAKVKEANAPKGGVQNYTVTFESNGGTSVPSQKVKAGDPISRPADPSWDGWIFSNWYSDEGLTEVYNFSSLVNATTTLYASWVHPDTPKYTVTFDYGDGDTSNTVEVYEGERVARPIPDPTRTGYVFDNWYNSALSSLFNFSIPITGPVTIIAKWIAFCEVIYHATDGIGTMENTTLLDNGVAKPLANNAFTYVGHHFDGWALTSGGAVAYTDGQSVRYTDLGGAPGATFDLYTVWTIDQYTVAFDSNGGSTPPESQAVDYNTTVTKPVVDPTKAYQDIITIAADFSAGLYGPGCLSTFLGWYNENTEWDFNNPVLGDMTLTAKWGNPIPLNISSNIGNNIVEKAITYINANPAAYILLLNTNFPDIATQKLNTMGVSLTLMGKDAVCTISSISDYVSMFTVTNGATLILNNNITLDGSTNGFVPVMANTDGTFIMNQGSKITGTNIQGSGGGVEVTGGGIFTMNGGEISGNTVSVFGYGGGVFVNAGSSFTMNGGKITDNTASSSSGGRGGGVVVDGNSSFYMNGGESSNNKGANLGGGVFVNGDGNTFTMTGGKIIGNIANYGGGVFVNGGNFTMNGDAIISGNLATFGGGVYSGDGNFEMNGGEISDNSVDSNGGGVYVYNGKFTMNGGEITGNSTSYSNSYGGGVLVDASGTGTFLKNPGGIITGYATGNNESFNIVKDGLGNIVDSHGHAVYVKGSLVYRRETTIESEEILKWENGAVTGNWTSP